MWKAASTPAGDTDLAPSRPLALARILVGCATLIELPATYSHLSKLLVPGAFHAPYPISPGFNAAWSPVLVFVMAILAIAVILGWQTKIALGGLAAAMGFLLALDQQLYRSDLYLLCLECFVLCLAGSGAALSLDRRREGSKDFVGRWPVQLLKIQLSIVYGSAVLSKLNPSFLRGDVIQNAIRLDVPSGLGIILAVATIATECFLALALWFQSTRRPAMLIGFLLHSSFVVLLGWGLQLLPFELEMLALYMQFPGIAPREYLVIYDNQSPFVRACARCCRALDWLRACRLETCVDTDIRRRGIEVVHGPTRLSGFEAVREIANVLPATWFLAPALSLPGFAALARRIYCNKNGTAQLEWDH